MCEIFTFRGPTTAMQELKAADPQMHQYMVDNGFVLKRGAEISPKFDSKTLYVTGDFGCGCDWTTYDLFQAIYNWHYAKS